VDLFSPHKFREHAYIRYYTNIFLLLNNCNEKTRCLLFIWTPCIVSIMCRCQSAVAIQSSLLDCIADLLLLINLIHIRFNSQTSVHLLFTVATSIAIRSSIHLSFSLSFFLSVHA